MLKGYFAASRKYITFADCINGSLNKFTNNANQ